MARLVAICALLAAFLTPPAAQGGVPYPKCPVAGTGAGITGGGDLRLAVEWQKPLEW